MKDPLEIPPFLRRKTGGRRRKVDVGEVTSAQAPAKVERVQLTEFCRLAETPAEESGMMMKDGVIPRRWYEGHTEKAQEELLARVHLDVERRRLREELRAEKEAKPERVHKYAGLVNLEDVLSAFNPRPDIALVKKAIRAARIPNDRWHFAPDLLQTVRNVIRAYKPGETKKARRSEFDPVARIKWSGKNPKHEGSSAYERWELVRTSSGKTVMEFLAAGGNPTSLRNAIAKGRVELFVSKETGETHGHEETGGHAEDSAAASSSENVQPDTERPRRRARVQGVPKRRGKSARPRRTGSGEEKKHGRRKG